MMRHLGPLAAALALAGCVAVTINVTFPQEKLENAASSIEDLVRAPAPGAPAPPAPAPRRDGRLDAPVRAAAASWLGPASAHAQAVPELRTRTPEVLAAIESRRGRYGELAAALAQGCLGENNQGLVEARPGTACPGTVAGLAAAENRDRMVLYQTLVQQNNMPPGDLARVQAAFAKTNRERAPGGVWVQSESGQWTRK